MKKIYLLSLVILVPMLCFSQSIDDKNSVFATGGYRVNGGRYNVSIGYERFLDNSNLYSLNVAFNYLLENKTIQSTYLVENANYLVEVSARRYFLKNGTSIVNPFVGLGVTHGKWIMDKSTPALPDQDGYVIGGFATIGSEFFLSKTFSLSVIGKYVYDSSHHIVVSAGAKYYF